MEFVNKVPDVLAKKLTSLGVEVKGVEVSEKILLIKIKILNAKF